MCTYVNNVYGVDPQILKCIICAHLADLEKMSSLERIAFLQEKLQDIRNHYLSLKSEVASIDRRRKRMKKKERESESALCDLSIAVYQDGVAPPVFKCVQSLWANVKLG